MEDEYKYQPLPDEDSIRVLILASGKDGEPLSGDLKRVRLSRRRRDVISTLWDEARRKPSSKAKTPRWTADVPYEAISYVWGSSVKDHTILLSGKVHYITAKLSESLHQCRLPDQPRVVWADSICIDQEKVEEKNHQVYLMGRIYASAQCTLICLGTDPDRRDQARDAFSVLSDANRMIQETIQSPDSSGDYNSFPPAVAGDPLLTDSRWKSVFTLVHEPWFSRGWVVQEAALGREARILWAGCEVPWLDFLRVYTWHERRIFLREVNSERRTDWKIPLLLRQTFIRERKTEAKVFFQSELSLDDLDILHALHLARSLSLTDPRDRIYAFMALPFVRSPVAALHPDYTQPHLELYRDFATKYLENTSDLNLLGYVTHEEGGESPEDILGSSWVPRWDRQAYVVTPGPGQTVFDNFDQKSTEPAEFEILHGRDGASATTLQVRAVIFDSVGLISPQFEESMFIGDVLDIWSFLTKQAGSVSKDFNTISDYDNLAFLCALAHGFFFGKGQEDWSTMLKSYSSVLQDNVQDPASLPRDYLPYEVHVCHGHLMSVAKDKHVFLLGRGYYGLGSWAIRPGDVCAFVKGVFSPLVLRKVSDEAGARHYKVIGPASIISKKVNEVGLPPVLHQWRFWGNWDELCGWEGWTDLGLKEEQINLV